jgi:ribosomal protein S27AE
MEKSANDSYWVDELYCKIRSGDSLCELCGQEVFPCGHDWLRCERCGYALMQSMIIIVSKNKRFTMTYTDYLQVRDSDFTITCIDLPEINSLKELSVFVDSYEDSLIFM